VLDSRLPAGTPPFNTTRDVNVVAAPYGVPATAQAFVFNATVVPPGSLGFITMWPQGQTRPLAATLNAYDGTVTNNMAIVPTTTGSVSVFPSAATHLVLESSRHELTKAKQKRTCGTASRVPPRDGSAPRENSL
jgi:hypothetical protein